ncbi:hypothetical protein [Nostoc sp.]|uniref:hypothetical protein n=1 Tax=Nostoc sp. TaxID=1180 RepID=UPI002FFC36C0
MLYDNHNTLINDCFLEVNPSFETQTGITQVKGKTAREIDLNNEAGFLENYNRVAVMGESIHFPSLSGVQEKYK